MNRKEVTGGTGVVITILLWMTLAIVVISAVGYGVDAYFLPWYTAIQRNVVEQSKSFTDSHNEALIKDEQAYAALDVNIAQSTDASTIKAYKAQQVAILNTMCETMSTMKPDTISPLVTSFVAQHGGCR